MKQTTIITLLAILVGTYCLPQPQQRIRRQADDEDTTDVPNEIETKLGLPSNATSIRANIVDTFSCEGRTYGYYADVENECQVFHVCLPVKYAGGKEEMFKWSFICPTETIFNQESFTCARPEDSVSCEEAPELYSLNANFGVTDKPTQQVLPRGGEDGIRTRTAAQDDAGKQGEAEKEEKEETTEQS